MGWVSVFTRIPAAAPADRAPTHSSSRHSGSTRIDIHLPSRSRSHSRHQSRSRSPSVASQDDDLHHSRSRGSPGDISPHYDIIHPTQSQSGSSSHPGEYVDIPPPAAYPSDLADGNGSESALRIETHDRDHPQVSRSGSTRRQPARRQQSLREREREPARLTRSRTRDLQADSPSEGGDSTEEFLRTNYPPSMPRPRSYYGPDGYTQSHSSGGNYPYPPVPHSNQVIPFAQPQPYPSHYTSMHTSPPVPYQHPAYQSQYPHAPSQVSSPYTTSPYGAPTIHNYPPNGYFPQYPPQFGGQGYPQPYMPIPQMPYPPYMDPRDPRVQHHQPSPQPASNSNSAEKLDVVEKARAEQEEMIKRFEAMMKKQDDEKLEAAERAKNEAAAAAARAEHEARIKEQALQQAKAKAEAEATERAERQLQEARIREEAMRQAAEKARAEAEAEIKRREQEARIREEARQEAIRAYEEQVRKAAEQAAREQQIRKEAAEAALRAAAEEAEKKAAKAAQEKKIAEDAAAAAKTAAERDAADAAAKAQEEARKAQEEASAKLKEAEEAAAKAKADAEEAEKKAAAAAPPEKRAPVRFKDAIGRNYNFPWERCHRWRDMEGLINQAFAHIDGLAEHVMNGRYDLIGPDKEIIMPGYWESTVEPDMHITMMLWPVPEPKPEEPPPPPDLDPDAVLNLDDILNPKPVKKPKKKAQRPGGFSMWMMGGAPSRGGKSLKGDKKPDVAAGQQHGATKNGGCIVM